MQGVKSCVFSVIVLYHLSEKSQMENLVFLFRNYYNTKLTVTMCSQLFTLFFSLHALTP